MDNKMIESELYQNTYRELHSWVDDYRKDFDLRKLGAFAISGDFGDYFPHYMNCYEIHELLKKHGVARKKTKHDHEHSCLYYYFNTMKAVEGFIQRFTKFVVKRKEIAEQYGLNYIN